MNLSLQMKVGLFAALVFLVIAYMTFKVSEKGAYPGGLKEATTILESATGLTRRTPVEVAGIEVGYIDDLELYGGRKALARLQIRKDIALYKDAKVDVKIKGFLGDVYLEIDPGHEETGPLNGDKPIPAGRPFQDLGTVATDVSEVTNSIQALSDRMIELADRNEENLSRLIASLAQFSEDLADVMGERKESVSETFERMRNISREVEEETVPAITRAATGVEETLVGVNRFQFEFGYHLEYLGETDTFKNYVGLSLKPRPDKAFLLEFIVDPDPSPIREEVTTTTTTDGGAPTTTVEEIDTIERDKFLISAQLAKSFYNLTLRGGLIESRGGVGIDYDFGPAGIQFSAFDFRTGDGLRPHLKALAQINLTRNFFLVSGVDDFISTQQDLDWFVGGGFRLIDQDIKSLFGVAAMGASTSR